MKEIEILAEILEEKKEKVKKRFKTRFKTPWHERGFFLFLGILMFVWFGLSIAEVIVRVCAAAFSLFKSKTSNQKLKTASYCILIAWLYFCTCLIGIVYPQGTLWIFDKIETFSQRFDSQPMQIIQNILRKWIQ
ncbi:MAG: hypothetical protein K940chlam8_00280 [Chlamydiae bacterium]|nr:hypothetical protein [Chlamydiota bacterium]